MPENELKLIELPIKAEQFTLYIDRKLGNIHGEMTLQRVYGGKVTKLLERLPFASGQYPFTDGGTKDWVNGKGPIPMGTHLLSTKRKILQMEPKGTPFYVISSEPGGRTINGPNGKQRGDIGIHLENQYPGSAGCVALLHDNPERSRLAWLFFGELDRLYGAGVRYIRTVVL